MFARKNTVPNENIFQGTKNSTIKIYERVSLFLAISLLSVIAISQPLYPNEFPVLFRLKPDNQHVNLNWEKNLDSEKFTAEQKIEGGEWEEVPGLQRKVKVGVALAGGIVRGVAHIGVLRVLEENYIPIDGISGTSMGSIIGGLYASGYSLDSLEFIVKEEIDWETFFQDQQPRRYTPIWVRIRNKPRPPAMEVALHKSLIFMTYEAGTGIRVAQKFTDEIANKTLGACYKAEFDFSKLPYSFGAILTNLNSGESKLKVDGSLSTALRASGSFPLAFEPMTIEGEQYVDGGVLDNLPVDAFLQDFDPSRKPDNIITIHDEEKGEDIFVIASYPSKLDCVGEKATETGEEMSGLLGINVLGKTSSLAREFHVCNSWKRADGRIGIDIKGGFDFNEKKLNELIKAGRDAAKDKIEGIKKDLANREDKKDNLNISREIFKVGSVELFLVKDNDTLAIEKKKIAKKIKRAIKLDSTSCIERNDVCYALRNIYNTGDYKNVGASVDKNSEKLHIKFFLTEKDEYLKPAGVNLIMGKNKPVDSRIEKKVKESIRKKKRKLNFNEIKELVENEYVASGYISPFVDSAKYSSFEDKDSLIVYGNRGKYVKGVKITSPEDTSLGLELEGKYPGPLFPDRILERNKDIYKDYQLKTISVEGIKDSSLIISVRARTGHTLEFPNLTLDKDEGLKLFTEFRTKRIREWRNRSIYVSIKQGFPLKTARNLPQGYTCEIGVNKCDLMAKSCIIFPDVSLGMKRLYFPGRQDTTLYNIQYDEYLSGSVSWSYYYKDLAFIVGAESSLRRYINGTEEERPFNGYLRVECDNLERLVFPTFGTKISFEYVCDFKEQWCSKMKIKGKYVNNFKLLNKLTVLTSELYISGFHPRSYFSEHYSMGGMTPIGSYPLSFYDFEDLPGYKRNEFMKMFMTKLGGSARVTLFNWSLLGLRANIHCVGSLYGAWTSETFNSFFNGNSRVFVKSSTLGFYIDTSFLNFGIGLTNIHELYKNVINGNFDEINLYQNLYASFVIYGAGF